MKTILRKEYSHMVGKVCCVAFATLLSVVAGCSNDDAPAPVMRPQLPAEGGAPVKSISHMGSVLSSYDWDFSYSDGRLVSAAGVMRDPAADLDKTFSYVSKIAYGSSNVAVSNSNGAVTDVKLNSSGYIERMTVNGNIYEFRYIDGRLAGWNKTVFENSLGPAAQYYSSAQIEYLNGNFSRIVYTETGNAPVVLTFTPSAHINRNGLLPETVSKELGVLSFEHLYYAGLMGRTTANLVSRISVSYPDEASSRNYTIDFEYNEQKGNTVLCSYHTPDGNLASVNYGY